MKIVSWNINSVRFRIEIVEKFLREVAPDILCLQETKVIDADFPEAVFRALGYDTIFLHGQRDWNIVVERDRFPVDQAAGGQLRRRLHQRLELVAPIEALAGLKSDLTILDAHLYPITVELDLVNPPFR